MKYTFLFLIFISFFSCKQESNKENIASSPPGTTIAKKAGELTRQKACETLSDEKFCKIMNWNLTDFSENETFVQRDLSVCNCGNGKEQVLIRLSWKSINHIEHKLLAEEYDRDLQVGEDGVVFEEISRVDEVHTIVSHSLNQPLGKYQYFGKKRFNNNSELEIEIRTSTDDYPAYKDKLVAMLKLIE